MRRLGKRDRHEMIADGTMVSLRGRWFVDLEALEDWDKQEEEEEKAKAAEASSPSLAKPKRGAEHG